MISIITPVLNERSNIEPFFTDVDKLDGDFEIIVVDGGSTDGTLDEMERLKGDFRHPLKVLNSSQGRALQMNLGAEAARGDILLFLHVDSQIPRDSLLIIENEINDDHIIGGGFTHSFHSPDYFLKLASAFGNARTRATQIYFGDFGIFLRRDIFEKMGGYDELPYLEDVEFCKKAKKYGRMGQIDRLITTSPRRYHVKGKFRLTAFFSLAVFLNMLRLRPNFLYKWIIEM